MRKAVNFSAPTQAHQNDLDEFAQDHLNLFTGITSGHMEKWAYASSLFPGDPAGGSEYWADLVKYPGSYYLTHGDIRTISWSVRQPELIDHLHDIQTVIELGPGSQESVELKTIPFLKAAPQIKKYIAVDISMQQASHAARQISQTLSVESDARAQDYFNNPLSTTKSKTAIIMWGSSLGNITGPANTDPVPDLVRSLKTFKSGLKKGDLLILCLDGENDERRILNAYNEPSQKAGILSSLYRLKRDGYTSGKFDPRIWRYEAAWFSEFGQCAHMVYPLFDQHFSMSGRILKIPAWRRFIANNSFKIVPGIANSAIARAGLTLLTRLQDSSISLYICRV